MAASPRSSDSRLPTEAPSQQGPADGPPREARSAPIPASLQPPLLVRVMRAEISPEEYERRWARFDALLLAMWEDYRSGRDCQL